MKYSLINSELLVVGRVLEFEVKVIEFVVLEVNEVGIDLMDGFLEGFFECMINGYDFVDGFYGIVNVVFNVLEF